MDIVGISNFLEMFGSEERWSSGKRDVWLRKESYFYEWDLNVFKSW